MSPRRRLDGDNNAWSSKEADLASLARICHVEQLYIDPALALEASTRLAAAAGSCLIDLHMHCVDDSALESKVVTAMLMLGQARKLTLRASRGSVTLSSYT